MPAIKQRFKKQFLKKQAFILFIFIVIAYFIGVPPIVSIIDSLIYYLGNNLKLQSTITISNPPTDEVIVELYKTLFAITFTIYGGILLAIIVLYQNIYKVIDDKFKDADKRIDDKVKDIKTELDKKYDADAEKYEFRIENNIEKRMGSKVENVQNDFNKVKQDLSEEYNKTIQEKENILKKLNSLVEEFELRIRIDEFIDASKINYGEYLQASGSDIYNNAQALIKELFGFESILRCIVSDDKQKVAKNLDRLTDILIMGSRETVAKDILEYLTLLNKNGKFDSNEEAKKRYRKILTEFYNLPDSMI
jgi:archaellum component FlaC